MINRERCSICWLSSSLHSIPCWVKPKESWIQTETPTWAAGMQLLEPSRAAALVHISRKLKLEVESRLKPKLSDKGCFIPRHILITLLNVCLKHCPVWVIFGIQKQGGGGKSNSAIAYWTSVMWKSSSLCVRTHIQIYWWKGIASKTYLVNKYKINICFFLKVYN